ncbi:hypothetical protein CTI12_AA063920 [Artemisia annua]|uniref:Uncharacterized protein n=1 Tax=Artemisia annua TaxID=35608 RepID=A0A2U1Q800_ARTAN|nr:hypothetical protein CTI12_AA063920 [Artemisia annua]
MAMRHQIWSKGEYGLLEAENTQVGLNSKIRKDHHEINKLELDARCKEVDNKRDKLIENAGYIALALPTTSCTWRAAKKMSRFLGFD